MQEERYPTGELQALDRIIAHQEAHGFRSFAVREREHTSAVVSDHVVESLSAYEQTLNRLLSRYGVTTEVRKVRDHNICEVPLSASAREMIPALPAGYVVVGGGARAALARSLGLDDTAAFRDLDIVAMHETPDPDELERLSKEYMPDDFVHGHGVKEEDGDYFETRDFTINEIYIEGDQIYCTTDCLLDTVRGIVRITEHEVQESYRPEAPYYINPKLLAKALRFAAAREATIANPEDYTYINIDDFHMALHFDRAAEQGPEVLEGYVALLREHGQIPEELASPEALYEYLKAAVYDFVFRCVDTDTLRNEPELLAEELEGLADLADDHEHLPKHEGMKRQRS